jgi:hypothetical protein
MPLMLRPHALLRAAALLAALVLPAATLQAAPAPAASPSAAPGAASDPAKDNAGRAVFVRGLVSAKAGPLQRAVNARDPIFRQDTVEAGAQSSARFVMRDKSMLALQPGTTISIAEYHFETGDPGSDRMVTGVVKGSLRALTGLVDKRNKEAVLLKTQIATIGVRGTAIRVEFFADGHQEITFDIGKGYVENLAGRVDVEEGFSARVLDANTLPELFKKLLDPNDPAVLARNLAGMSAKDAENEARRLARLISNDDLILLLGMLDQLPDIDQDEMLGILEGLLRGNPDLAPALILTAVRLHQELAALVLERGVQSGLDVSLVLHEVLRALETPTKTEIDLVLIQAVQEGISMEGAQAVLKQLRDAGLCT